MNGRSHDPTSPCGTAQNRGSAFVSRVPCRYPPRCLTEARRVDSWVRSLSVWHGRALLAVHVARTCESHAYMHRGYIAMTSFVPVYTHACKNRTPSQRKLSTVSTTHHTDTRGAAAARRRLQAEREPLRQSSAIVMKAMSCTPRSKYSFPVNVCGRSGAIC